MMFRRFLLLPLLTLVLTGPAFAQAPAPAPVKIKITNAADLPVHTYNVGSKVSSLLDDPAQVLALAAAVSANITGDLAKYDIADRATQSSFYQVLVITAVIQKDYPADRENLRMLRSLEDKPADRITRGLLSESLLDALQTPGPDFHAALRTNIERLYGAVPYALVRDHMQEQKSQMEILSHALVVGQFTDASDAQNPAPVSQNIAIDLLNAAFTLEYILPNKADIAAAYSAVQAAHKPTAKPDIWAARAVTLPPLPKLTPVTVAIWDSGVDVSLFKSHAISGQAGIAFDARQKPTSGLLYPLPGGAAAARVHQNETKGMLDLQAGINSPEAAALKTEITSLPPDKVRPFFAGLDEFTSYAHGTHVAGIALRGNPTARLLVCRVTLDDDSKQGAPSVSLAEDTAAMYRQSVAYFQKRGVRMVNISWIVPLAGIDYGISHSGVGGTPAEQHALAGKIYGIMSQGFADAVQAAPDILFVVAAGNDNQNVLFDSSYPAGLKAPNLVVVGAVDGAGDETSFTSFGNVDVYADGVDVPSFVPGGATLKLSGTSMAAPQVTNLAAKILAEHPGLSVAQLKAAILHGADPHTVGGRTIRLLNPKKTLDLLNTHR